MACVQEMKKNVTDDTVVLNFKNVMFHCISVQDNYLIDNVTGTWRCVLFYLVNQHKIIVQKQVAVTCRLETRICFSLLCLVEVVKTSVYRCPQILTRTLLHPA